MLWLTLRQEIHWCDDFMAQFSSAGDLNSEIASGQRRIQCWFFFFNFIFLLFSQLCGHRVTIVAAAQFIRIAYQLDTIWGLQLSLACPHGAEERNLASYQPILGVIQFGTIAAFLLKILWDVSTRPFN